jgi:hypothetical protein
MAEERFAFSGEQILTAIATEGRVASPPKPSLTGICEAHAS